MKSLTVAAVVDELDHVIEFISNELEEAGCSFAVEAQVSIAVDEIFSNIVHYAYGDDGGTVDVFCDVNDDKIEVSMSDSGVPYNPLKKADPDITLSAEEREIGGLGIFMVKKTMDGLMYEHRDGKNILTIVKNIGASK